MENQVYKCTWKRVEKGFELSTKENPRLIVTGETFETAEDDLHDLVCLKLGDGESVFEFDPPAPVHKKAKSFFEPALFVFSANDSIRQKNNEPGLYAKGYCECCGGGLGSRTKKIRTLTEVPSCDVSFLWGAKPQVKLFSEKLTKFLQRAGLSGSAFQEVHFTKKTTRKYSELVAKPEIDLVGVKYPPQPTGGWECVKCGMRWIHPFHRAVTPSVTHYLSRSDFNRLKIPIVTTGSSYQRTICMTALIAARVRKLNLKGIVTERLAVLDEREINRNPKVKTIKSFT
jgi:hypothetical protein